MWILDHLDDIESDLSAVHRVDDMWSLPAGRFARLAERLWHYPGVMRSWVVQQQAAIEPGVPDVADADGLVDLAEFGDVIEFAGGG